MTLADIVARMTAVRNLDGVTERIYDACVVEHLSMLPHDSPGFIALSEELLVDQMEETAAEFEALVGGLQ